MDEKLIARFWKKVDRKGPDECWPWLAAIGTHGYGVIGQGSDRLLLAHRLSYEIARGPIPQAPAGYHGTTVMHSCDSRACVNPAHLSAGTQADNLADMTLKGRRCAKRKLSAGEVAELRRLYGSTLIPQRELAKMYGVGQATVSRYLNMNRP